MRERGRHIARLVVVGLLLVAPSLVGARQNPPVYLLRADLDEFLKFEVIQESDLFSVQLYSPEPLVTYSIQVWLLRADGTALPRRASQAPRATPTGVPRMTFAFEPADRQSLVALVVNSGGDVVVAHPIAQTSARREEWEDDWVEPSWRRMTPKVDELQDVSLEEQDDFLELSLVGPFVLERIEGSRTLPRPERVQVWIVRSDGTALRRRPETREMAPTANGGWTWQLAFERVRRSDLAAVIVRLDERLFLYETR